MNEDLNEVIDQINKAFFRLESYMNSKTSNYQYFGFDLAFTKLFTKGKINENFTYENCKLISQYWHLLERLRYDIDQGNYESENIFENEDFEKDSGEIYNLAWDRCDEFSPFKTPDEVAKEEAELSFSITDIINTNISKPPKQQYRITYQWQNNADKELPELYTLLINEYKLIASDTTLEQFTTIFTGQSIESVKPVKWNATKSLNAYFIEQLINKNKLSKAINTDIWEISKYCFSNGTNFSQLIDNYNNNKIGKPRDYNLIDDLLNAL
jgi:hypothetical protein